MSLTKCLNYFVVLPIIQIYLFRVILAELEDVYYIAQFNDKITECEDFENNFLKCENLVIGFVSDSAEKGMGLSGQMNLMQTVADDLLIELKINKETPVGKEFLYSFGGNFCDNLQMEDGPWYPLIKSLNVTECPIEPTIFDIENMVISLDFAKDLLRHEYCGSYVVEMSILSSTEIPLSCHIVPLEVIEKTRNKT